MKVKEAWKEIFLRHLGNGAATTVAAQLANVGMDRVIQAKNRDRDFAAKIESVSAAKKKQVKVC